MKIKDLIAKLQSLDPEFDVVIPGYEGGLCDIESVEPIGLRRDVNIACYYGPHKLDENSPHSAVFIS